MFREEKRENDSVVWQSSYKSVNFYVNINIITYVLHTMDYSSCNDFFNIFDLTRTNIIILR